MNKGTVFLELGDEEFELRPTLKAYQKIQTRFGGLRGALVSVQEINLDHVTHIVAAGAGVDRKDMDRLKKAIYEEGIANVTEKIVPFLTAMMGTSSDDDEEDEGEKKPIATSQD